MKVSTDNEAGVHNRDVADHHELVEMASNNASDEHDALPASDEDNASSQPGSSLPHEIRTFASQHNLENKLDVLTQAHHLLHSGRPRNGNLALPLTPPNLTALKTEPTSKWSQPFLLYLCITATALGAIGQGWVQTGINGANLYWPEALRVGSESARDRLVVGIINSGIYLSNALLGSWLVAPLNQKLGRRGAVFAGAVVSLVFNGASSGAGDWVVLLGCRLALGIGLGVVNSTLNIFAAECAPAAIRGGLGVAWQMFTAFGIFLGFLTNMLVDNAPGVSESLRWRLMLLAPALPTIPLLALIFMCPESPSYWIKQSGGYDKAFQSLCRLRNTELQAARDLLVYYQEQQQLPTASEESPYLRTLAELFTMPRVRRATIAAYSTMLTQQLCGINIVRSLPPSAPLPRVRLLTMCPGRLLQQYNLPRSEVYTVCS